MEDLAKWLLEQIAEDEQMARKVASPPPWAIDDQQRDDRAIYGAARGATVAYDPSGDSESKADFAHIVRWDPARVLAECAAKRRIVDLHTIEDRYLDCPTCTDSDYRTRRYDDEQLWWCDTLKLLALPYVDRPGYRPEWRP